MKTWIVPLALLSLTGLVFADELDDNFASLKEAVTAKNVDTIKKLAGETSALARKAVAATKPDDVEQDAWNKRVEYAKEVDTYTEYALAFAAQSAGDPAKTADLVDMLIAQNPKSKFLDERTTLIYMSALFKAGGAAKQLEGATKVEKIQPDNVVALQSLTELSAGKAPDRALGYANKLVSVVRTKAKPEGFPEADWDRIKSNMMGTGLYTAGVIYAQKQAWTDCDRELKAAIPYINKDNGKLGPAYYYLGICNYQFAKITNDRSRIQTAEKYSEQAAAIPGPVQAQANTNVVAMQKELGAPVVRK